MLSYGAYGLTIRSQVPLPLARVENGVGADVVVRFGSLEAEVMALRGSGREYAMQADEARFYWSDIGAFVARGGIEIVADPAPGAADADVELGVLGPALATILYQRGLVLLHASVTDVAGTAAAVLGRSGWGKSTIAAALGAQGHSILTDDIAAIRLDDAGAVVYPGTPHLKVWPDVAAAVGARAEELPEVAPGFQKRVIANSDRWSAMPARLGRIYVLATGDRVAIEPLSARDAFLELANHSLAVRWFLSCSNAGQFAQRARLVREVPVARLRRPRDLARLPEVVALLEQDIAHG